MTTRRPSHSEKLYWRKRATEHLVDHLHIDVNELRRQVAMAAGATGDDVIRVAEQLVQEGVVRVDRAREVLVRNS